MPNFKTHATIGAAGALAVGTIAITQNDFLSPPQFLLGAVIGSVGGSSLPDILDLPTTPNHRDVAHSVATGGSLLKFLFPSELFQQKNSSSNIPGVVDTIEKNLKQKETKQGFKLGFALGYILHLVLDAGTDDGIPLVSRHLV